MLCELFFTLTKRRILFFVFFILQDEPLPHELRPPHVLTMTMDYLVTMVINNHSAVGSGEWFNFIWNRTRAVRKVNRERLCFSTHTHTQHTYTTHIHNTHTYTTHTQTHTYTMLIYITILLYTIQDITLQHLCSPAMAEIVEKCARLVYNKGCDNCYFSHI